MSAWIVGFEHVDAMLRLAEVHGNSAYSAFDWHVPDDSQPWGIRTYKLGTTRDHFTQVGRMLLLENERSIIARYPDVVANDGSPLYDRMPGPIDYPGFEQYEYPRRVVECPSIAAGMKIISCYEYQTCEHEGWKASEAYAFCDALRRALASALPGYDSAPWGWEHDQDPRVPLTAGRVAL